MERRRLFLIPTGPPRKNDWTLDDAIPWLHYPVWGFSEGKAGMFRRMKPNDLLLMTAAGTNKFNRLAVICKTFTDAEVGDTIWNRNSYCMGGPKKEDVPFPNIVLLSQVMAIDLPKQAEMAKLGYTDRLQCSREAVDSAGLRSLVQRCLQMLARGGSAVRVYSGGAVKPVVDAAKCRYELGEDALCAECGIRHCTSRNEILFCDNCDLGFHQYCVGQSGSPPSGDWFCPTCSPSSCSAPTPTAYTKRRAVTLPEAEADALQQADREAQHSEDEGSPAAPPLTPLQAHLARQRERRARHCTEGKARKQLIGQKRQGGKEMTGLLKKCSRKSSPSSWWTVEEAEEDEAEGDEAEGDEAEEDEAEGDEAEEDEAEGDEAEEDEAEGDEAEGDEAEEDEAEEDEAEEDEAEKEKGGKQARIDVTWKKRKNSWSKRKSSGGGSPLEEAETEEEAEEADAEENKEDEESAQGRSQQERWRTAATEGRAGVPCPEKGLVGGSSHADMEVDPLFWPNFPDDFIFEASQGGVPEPAEVRDAMGSRGDAGGPERTLAWDKAAELLGPGREYAPPMDLSDMLSRQEWYITSPDRRCESTPVQALGRAFDLFSVRCSSRLGMAR
ncbi:hypothetical protein CYMTET_19936 [Cymbomonas tetramitiformis]|uniref:PHD-type domain-containing protein n=1 Tax=Cymbomonas tetramitiformis TaxID=36881 RepID=A0AAE0G560_9CHLO|nr:hypothetical protein CYMTET_19936 [Cymbomonas tetramitiformis]